MTRPFKFQLLVVLAAAILPASPLALPVAADEPTRVTATAAPGDPVVCCGGGEVDAPPERRNQTLVAQNDSSEPAETASGGPPVDLVRTVANRNPKAGGPNPKEKWHVWVTKRNDAPAPSRFEKIVVHVEPYSFARCGEGPGKDPRCAKATIWLYSSVTEGDGSYRLLLKERYRKILLTIVKTAGPTRGLAFRAERAKTDESGNEDAGKNRVFLITGTRNENDNSRNYRSLRVTTYLVPVTRSVDSDAGQKSDRSHEYREECIDYVDDAYYDEEDYEEDYTGEEDYDYEDPPEDDSPYEDEPYDYEE